MYDLTAGDKYFESHAHYDDKVFNDDREELLSSLPEMGVGIIINSGANIKSSLKGIEMAKKYPHIYAAVGVHPHDVKNLDDSHIDIISDMCDYEKTVSVGEIGLDYYYDLSPRDMQKKWFITQIEIAKNKNLPIIVHSRDATEETFEIIKNNDAKKVGGVVHCFSGSYEMAAEYVKLGFYIGIGGVVTYKNAKKLVEVVEKIPLEHLLIETDCPYLSPEPHRGKRNDSKNLKYIAAKIADIKKISTADVRNITFQNGMRLFNI